jgi:membrane-associated protease RseP (regulator of RpoE activity)
MSSDHREPSTRGSSGKRRLFRPRFSLRVLLLAITAFCVWIAYQTKRADERKRAMEYLVGVGANVGLNTVYDPPLYWKPAAVGGTPGQKADSDIWERLRTFIGRKYFDHPVRVTFPSRVSLDEQAISHLECLTDLVYLSLPNDDISNSVLDRLHRAAPRVYIERPGMAFLGINDKLLQPDQCLVSYVFSDSAAERAGILLNDKLVSLAGQKVRNWVDFMRIMSRRNRGDVVSLEVIRGTDRIPMQTTLGTRK